VSIAALVQKGAHRRIGYDQAILMFRRPAMSIVSCRECGRDISDQAVMCPGCGAGIRPLPQAHRTRTKAALFGIFLGGLGAHKFYTGRTTQGVFYLLFCWTFIPAIFGFIEGLNYLSMSDERFDKAFNA
jgi:TM2 domain-containing membrane protein YozV